MNVKDRTPAMRRQLLRGVLRRLYYNLFRKTYIRKSLLKRLGKCQRCGACCQLGWRCKCLCINAEGLPTCRIHKLPRPPNCKAFPIDPKDLEDRNLIAPDVPCGYSWKEHKPPRIQKKRKKRK